MKMLVTDDMNDAVKSLADNPDAAGSILSSIENRIKVTKDYFKTSYHVSSARFSYLISFCTSRKVTTFFM